MEAGNVLLMPAILLMVARWNPSWVSIVSLVPMVGLLIIGAYYWRAKLKQLEDRTYRFENTMRAISVSQLPALLVTLIAIGVVIYGWSRADVFTSGWDKGVATFAVTLAVLEYVNYYHRQLQHFDHGPDFKRLLSGNGLRPSQMSKDLKTYRGK